MGKTLSKTNCCAVDQMSSNLTISGELDKNSVSMDDEPIILNLSLDESREIPMPSINLSFACNYIQISSDFQEWPVCLSVECGELPLEERPGMDVVCLIETSQYSKVKEKLIKSAVEFLMNRLTGQDRLSIVSFCETGKRLSPLVSMTFTGKLRVNLLLQGLQYYGSCDLEAGMGAALSVLANRRNVNCNSHVIVLATGLDSNPESLQERIGEILRDFNMRTAYLFSCHVFALGYPLQVLNFIAEETNGSCFFNSEENEWMKSFAYCCGILESKIAEDVCAEIKIKEDSIPMIISKVYSESGETRFRMPDALAGSKMETIFILRILPQVNSKQYKSDLLSVEVKFKVKGVNYTEEKILSIPILASNVVMREIEIDEEVMVGFYRVKVADIMNEASVLAEFDLEAAKTLLVRGGKELEESCVFGNLLIRFLHQEIFVFAESVGECSVVIRNKARNHWSKREPGIEWYENNATIVNKNRLKSLFNIA